MKNLFWTLACFFIGGLIVYKISSHVDNDNAKKQREKEAASNGLILDNNAICVLGYKSGVALVRRSVPRGIKIIANRALEGCSSTEITLPDSVEIIGSAAFRNCKNLQKMKIPPKVTVIEEAAFAECENLEIVEFHSGITHIKQGAFRNCAKDKRLLIDVDENTHVDSRAFYGTKLLH